MAVDLPDSPSDGQVSNGLKYSSSKGYWDYDTASGGATTYATVSALPTSGVTDGTQAFVTGTNRLYIYNSGWKSVAVINANPTYTTSPNSSYTLAMDGTATTITIVATDPDGFPITYTATASGMGSIATLTGPTGAGNNVFTVTPSTSVQGTFTITFSASDGTNSADVVSSFTLILLSPYWKNIALSTGTSTTNALQNSTYIDRSSSPSTITTYGQSYQGTFNPYGKSWSMYFDGSNDYLTKSGALLPTTSSPTFTTDMWIYATDNSAQRAIWTQHGGVGGSTDNGRSGLYIACLLYTSPSPRDS